MAQQTTSKTSPASPKSRGEKVKKKLYEMAEWTWGIVKFIWSGLIIAFLIGYLANFAVNQGTKNNLTYFIKGQDSKGYPLKDQFILLLHTGLFYTFGLIIIITVTSLLLIVLLKAPPDTTLKDLVDALLIKEKEQANEGQIALRHYLSVVKDMYGHIDFRGFHLPLRTLNFSTIPLESIYK